MKIYVQMIVIVLLIQFINYYNSIPLSAQPKKITSATFSKKDAEIIDFIDNKIIKLEIIYEELYPNLGTRIRIFNKKKADSPLLIHGIYAGMKTKKLNDHFVLITYGVGCGTCCKTEYAAIVASYNDSLRIVFNFVVTQNSFMDSRFNPEEKKDILYDSVYNVNTVEILGEKPQDYSLLMTKKFFHYSILKANSVPEDSKRTVILNFDEKQKIFFNATPPIQGKYKVKIRSRDDMIEEMKFREVCCSAISLGEDMFFNNARNTWYRYYVVGKEIMIEQTTSE